MKKLVVYYSLDGNTKRMAENIAEGISADLLRIIPVNDIPKAGFRKFYEGGKQATFGMCADLEPFPVDVNTYDMIVLGTPVWAFKPVPAINQFIELLKDESKVIGVFTLSGGGDDIKCMNILAKKLPNIKCSRAFADRKNRKLAGTNPDKLKSFIGELKVWTK